MANKSVSDASHRPLKSEIEIYLPTVDESCPGCNSYRFVLHLEYSSMTVAEVCAKHLFEECVKVAAERRHKMIKWILSYLMFNESQRLSECSCGLQLIKQGSKSEKLLKSKKWKEIAVPLMTTMNDAVPSQCPVCDHYFPSINVCYHHLFQSCLSTLKSAKDAVEVMFWLEKFLAGRKESLRKFSHLYGADKDCFVRLPDLNPKKTATFTCKYCKLGLPDEDSLGLHFETEHSEPRPNDGVACFLCNFKASGDKKLGQHFLTRHLSCGCQNFVDHFELKKCQEKGKPVPCPMCDKTFFSQACFIAHVLGCRPAVDEVIMNIDGMYPHCQLCQKRILITKLEEHLIQHAEEGTGTKNVNKQQTPVSVGDLKNNECFLEKKDFEELMQYIQKC